MAKNRVIYQSEGLYAGPSPATGVQYDGSNYRPTIKQLQRVQSINYSYSKALQDVNQFGELAAIDRISLEAPTVSLDFTYFNTNLLNEEAIGLYVKSGANDLSSAITNILNKTQDERNYWIKVAPEGIDLLGFTGAETGTDDTHSQEADEQFAIGIGNGFISSFSTEGAVGDFPTTSVTVEGLNISFNRSLGHAGTVINSWGAADSGALVFETPAVNPVDGTYATGVNGTTLYCPLPTGRTNILNSLATTVSALRPGDITFSLYTGGGTEDQTANPMGATFTDSKIQSYSIGYDLTREPLQKLGSKYAFSREISFPVVVNAQVNANVGDLTSGSLVQDLIDNASYDLLVRIKSPNDAGKAIAYIIKNAKLESQSFTSSIGPNKAVTYNFSAQIGSAAQTDRGFFMTGSSQTI